jgi:large subunit ribosomal protein L22
VAEKDEEKTPDEKPKPKRKPAAKKPAAKKPAAKKAEEAKAEEAKAEEKPKPKRKPAAKKKPAAEKPAATTAAKADESAEAVKQADAAKEAEADAAEAEGKPEPEDEKARPRRRGGAAAAGSSSRRRSPARSENGATTVRAKAKYVRCAPRKARLVIDHIRGKDVDQARAILMHTPRAASRDVLKLLDSAIANAENNHELVADELRVDKAYVDEGPTLKRYRPRALGRATRIRKRTSHLTIELTSKE